MSDSEDSLGHLVRQPQQVLTSTDIKSPNNDIQSQFKSDASIADDSMIPQLIPKSDPSKDQHFSNEANVQDITEFLNAQPVTTLTHKVQNVQDLDKPLLISDNNTSKIPQEINILDILQPQVDQCSNNSKQQKYEIEYEKQNPENLLEVPSDVAIDEMLQTAPIILTSPTQVHVEEDNILDVMQREPKTVEFRNATEEVSASNSRLEDYRPSISTTVQDQVLLDTMSEIQEKDQPSEVQDIRQFLNAQNDKPKDKPLSILDYLPAEQIIVEVLINNEPEVINIEVPPILTRETKHALEQQIQEQFANVLNMNSEIVSKQVEQMTTEKLEKARTEIREKVIKEIQQEIAGSQINKITNYVDVIGKFEKETLKFRQEEVKEAIQSIVDQQLKKVLGVAEEKRRIKLRRLAQVERLKRINMDFNVDLTKAHQQCNQQVCLIAAAFEKLQVLK